MRRPTTVIKLESNDTWFKQTPGEELSRSYIVSVKCCKSAISKFKVVEATNTVKLVTFWAPVVHFHNCDTDTWDAFPWFYGLFEFPDIHNRVTFVNITRHAILFWAACLSHEPFPPCRWLKSTWLTCIPLLFDKISTDSMFVLNDIIRHCLAGKKRTDNLQVLLL